MTNRDAYIEGLDAQLRNWSASLDVLKGKAARATADLRVAYHKQIDDLKFRHQSAQHKVHELKAVSEDAWDGARTAIEKAWGEIKSAFDNAT